MTIAENIIKYASTHKQPFQVSDLMQNLKEQSISLKSAKVVFYRLVNNGILEKIRRGCYRISSNQNQNFQYTPSQEEVELGKRIREKFPFIEFCIWKPSILTRYMQHIPTVSMLFIDVEKDVSDAVFYFLQGILPQKKILLNPSRQECELYINSDDIIIIRTLINEAPVLESQFYKLPSIEKVLVDAVSDKELLFAQGAELYTIYENAIDSNNVNRKRLLRYAARRNRKDKVNSILQTIEQ